MCSVWCRRCRWGRHRAYRRCRSRCHCCRRWRACCKRLGCTGSTAAVAAAGPNHVHTHKRHARTAGKHKPGHLQHMQVVQASMLRMLLTRQARLLSRCWLLRARWAAATAALQQRCTARHCANNAAWLRHPAAKQATPEQAACNKATAGRQVSFEVVDVSHTADATTRPTCSNISAHASGSSAPVERRACTWTD